MTLRKGVDPAFYSIWALLDGDDLNRTAALDESKEFSESGTKLFTSVYVRLESCSLIQRRLGVAALCDYRDGFLPLMKIISVGEQGFELAFEKWRLARRKQLSLIDITSFDCLNRQGIFRAYSFDKHFAEQGFQLCPSRP